MTANPKPLPTTSMHSTRIQLDESIRSQSSLLLNQALADLSDLDKSLWFLAPHTRK